MLSLSGELDWSRVSDGLVRLHMLARLGLALWLVGTAGAGAVLHCTDGFLCPLSLVSIFSNRYLVLFMRRAPVCSKFFTTCLGL
jgi:hypothetical protein